MSQSPFAQDAKIPTVDGHSASRTARLLQRMAWRPSSFAPWPHEVDDLDRLPPPVPPAWSEEEGHLRRAILRDPEADPPRLRYADWLSARGQPRGEFIRLQLRLAQGLASWADRQREQRLLREHAPLWLSELAPWAPRDPEFHRGFVEHATLTGRTFLSRAEGLFETTPLRSVRLIAITPFVPELAASAQVGKVRELRLPGCRIGPEGGRLLLDNRHLAILQALDLSRNHLGSEVAVRFAFGQQWPNLQRLDLSGNALDADTATALFGNDALTSLDLSRNALGPTLGRRWASAPRERPLDWLGLAEVGLTAEGGQPLAEGLRRGLIRKLDLRLNALGPTGVAPWNSVSANANLEWLDLGFNDLGDDGAIALAQGTWGNSLHTLGLAGNRIGNRGCQALAGCAALDAVRDWNLSANWIGDVGLTALARSTKVRCLRSLNLANNFISDAGVQTLLTQLTRTGLTTLVLAWNHLTDVAARALADCPALAELETLDLSGNRLSYLGAQALARSPWLNRLQRLKVMRNERLWDSGLALLRERFGDDLQS